MVVLPWPFPQLKSNLKLDKPFKTQLQKIFNSYKDPEGNPVHELSVVGFRIKLFKGLLPKEDQEIAELIRLLSFSVMAENDYYQQVGQYFNATHFQSFYQRFQVGSQEIAPRTRRRDGSTLHGGYKHGELKFSMPLEAATNLKARPNIPLLQSLVKCLRQDTSDAAAIRGAINWFFLANTDSNSVTPETEIIMMSSAFETLLQVQDQREKKKALMDRLPGLSASSLVKEAVRKGTDGKRQKRSWKVWWIDEFYWLRNKIIHGGKLVPKPKKWTVNEHLTIAAMVLANGVKLKLANLGFYTLEPRDKKRADSIDLFIEGGNLTEKKLLGAERDAAGKRAIEEGWKKLRRRFKA